MKYKVGDKVRIVSEWNEKTNQNRNGKMDKWLGKVMTIRDISRGSLGNYYLMKEDKGESFLGIGWLWNEHCIAGLAVPTPQKIVITTEGRETIARLFDGEKVIKSASATCHPDDKFDFTIGAKIALARLRGEEPEYRNALAEPPDLKEHPCGETFENDGKKPFSLPFTESEGAKCS